MDMEFLDHKHVEAIQVQRMEAISFLAAGISHDIKNLLMVILNCASVIKEMNTNRDIQKRIEVIISCCEKMKRCSKDLCL